jgi:tetratricopeptide (TPR) repeat protein
MNLAHASPADSLQRAAQAFGAGDVRGSLRLLRRAVEADPTDPDKHYALGRCQRALNDDAGAEESYRHALKLRPELTEAWISLGILLKHLGRHAEAEGAQRAALRLEPESFLAHLNLGNALLAQGRSDEAAASLRDSLRANPDCAEAHNNLGRILLSRRERGDAAQHFVEALRINPRYFEAALNMGDALIQVNEHAEAIKPLTLAHRLHPEDVEARRLLGRAFSGAGEYLRAAAEFEAILHERPGDRDARFDLALALFYAGQYTRPRTMIETLLSEQYNPFAAMAYSSLLLRTGEFREGWVHYESRWSIGEPGARSFTEPRWQGESLAGKTLLIAREQGLGDEIMFASIFPEVLPLAAHCIIECEQRLVALYQRSFPAATIFGVGQTDPEWNTRLDGARSSLPRFDYWASFGDLARLRRGDAAEFPRHQGYLAVDATRAAEFRERLRTRSGNALKVGIGWRGGTSRSRAAERSLTLEDLRPLLSMGDVHFVSLQYGSCIEELDSFRNSSGVNIDHWQEAIDDIDAYAALVSSLDLVISVCSAVIHLSGALGRPAWVMAPMVPEWRYGRDGESMIWYPSIRMFRQDKSRAWPKVIGNVKRALSKLPRDTRARGVA